jgi:molecular chaperone HtpG
MTEPAVAPETLEFRTEVQQLLNILAHSLYTEREIFLRELVSNASDALHRMQFELLTDRNVVDPDAELAIRIDWDADQKTITIADTGVGMTRDELISDLGTIAHSGALSFIRQISEGQKPADIIGQFGVGFYSVFMIADEVTVTTRSYRKGETAWRWKSSGDSRFTLEPAERDARGTEIVIKLKEDAEEFAARFRLQRIVERHSNYVSFPIYVGGEVVNKQTALWRKPMGEVKEEEYADFYRQLTYDLEPPLLQTHIVTDAPVEIRSILFVPRKLDRSVLNLRADYGIRLYSRKVLIQERNKELLPEYLRFVEGVVDSEDIPLNVSRETVQSNKLLRAMQKVLAGRVVKALKELAGEKPEDYVTFWNELGVFLKQGVAAGEGDRKELLPLLRFESTRGEGKLVSLNEYLGRMIEGQEKIYYILGNDPGSVAASPHLDPFKARGIEVLYMPDPFDGFMMQSVHEFEGKGFANVDDPGWSFRARRSRRRRTRRRSPDEDFAQVVARFKTVLSDRVTEVRESKLLTGHPARLVSTNAGLRARPAAHPPADGGRLQGAAEDPGVNRRHRADPQPERTHCRAWP